MQNPHRIKPRAPGYPYNDGQPCKEAWKTLSEAQVVWDMMHHVSFMIHELSDDLHKQAAPASMVYALDYIERCINTAKRVELAKRQADGSISYIPGLEE